MKYLNIMFYILAGYIVLVLLAEALIWRIQPTMDGGVKITITPNGGPPFDRHLYGFERDGKLFVSSNHWFRRWYNTALEHPDVEVMRDGVVRPFTAVAVGGEEHERVSREYNMGFVLRLLCGFAPSKFLRLEPRS